MTFRMHITERDQLTLKYVERFGSITISQCQKFFYPTQNYGYDMARRRLKKLVGYGKLKVARDMVSNQNVYFTDKKLSFHDILVLDYMVELKRCGADIKRFMPRKSWMDNSLFSDAYCVYTVDNQIFFDIVEVVRTHKVDKDKYIKLFESGEAQLYNAKAYMEISGGMPMKDLVFPRIIVVDEVRHSKPISITDGVTVFQLDFNFSDIAKVFV